MKRVSIITAAAVLLFAGACRHEDDAVSKLPELPDELRATLGRSLMAPVLMTQSKTFPPAAHPAPPPTSLPAVNTVCVRYYKGYIVYPITVCYPPSILVGGLNWNNVQATDRPPTAPAPRLYKLSSFPGLTISRALYCTQLGGPWYAEVTETPRCENINASDFRLDIIAAPQPVSISWTGAFTDAPPPVNTNLFSEAGEGMCTCCNGGTWCPSTQSCALPGHMCPLNTPPPARREPN
jgi:hypothetical protein